MALTRLSPVVTNPYVPMLTCIKSRSESSIMGSSCVKFRLFFKRVGEDIIVQQVWRISSPVGWNV